MSYPIDVNLIPGLPKNPFERGVGAYEGIVLHATAVYDDTADAERNYEASHWQSAFVHAFVDDTRILQTADFDYIAWHAGPSANNRYLGFELCQTHDAAKFTAAYDRWTWLAAQKLHDRNLGVTDGVTLLSHKEVSDRWHETDHTDPIEYLAEHGKTWADVVADVQEKYNALSGAADVHPASSPEASRPAPVSEPELQQGAQGEDVKVLQQKLGFSGSEVDGIFGPQTLAAVKTFQHAHGLVEDGIVGPKTWAALNAPHPTTEPVQMPTVKLWSHGSAVVSLQKHLGIAADGIFGPITLWAVKKFQSTHGLQVDGIVGPLTWAKLLG